jgi:hypothetical protein
MQSPKSGSCLWNGSPASTPCHSMLFKVYDYKTKSVVKFRYNEVLFADPPIAFYQPLKHCMALIRLL